MFWRTLRAILRPIVIEASLSEGDTVRIVVIWHGKTVVDRKIKILSSGA